MRGKFMMLELAALATAVEATTLTIQNQCSESIGLYDNSASETIASGGITTRTLSSGFSGMFRNGVSAQATLAEFSITGGYTWYDISIIPTGSSGPGNCASLGECKEVTGGTGFNTPMQIAPTGCTTVTCLEDGCADAYQYPSDDSKTHSCVDTASVTLTFCPGGTSSSTSTSSTTTPVPTPTSAPTTEAPISTPSTQAPATKAPVTDPITDAPTTAPVTEALTTAPVTNAPETEAPVSKPTTEAPTRAPTYTPTLATTTQAPISVPTPTQTATEAPTETPTPTTAQVFKLTIPTGVPVAEEPTSSPTVVPTPTSSSSWDGSGSSSSSSGGSLSGNTITFPPADNMTQQAAAATTTRAPTSADSNGQTTTTETASSSGTRVGTIVAATVGAVAVVGAIAAIIVVRRKKQQVDASALKDDLEWLDEFSGMATPVTRIPTMGSTLTEHTRGRDTYGFWSCLREPEYPTMRQVPPRLRDYFAMQLHMLVATFLGAAATTANAIPVQFHNRCSVAIELYNNTYTEVIDPGCSTTRYLEEGFSGMFRNGWNPQATLAEFSVSWGFLWYDISIIPTSPQSGPGNCLSLDDCKKVTGGVGFNTPIQIAPSGCTAVTCLADGCTDAYQYPTDDWKTRACPDTTPNVDVTFCPVGSSAVVTPAPTKPKCPRRCTASLRS
ncbi:hypothetical protein PC119_g14984 [Phytophthora cactorum]|nr:hypothetical protein PC111_g13117 [Phytophthora cactorum]KAG2819512.1 hypothetical protein PC112_g12158 [Phytophthora cactorum]KAG2855214.1 hypothetical protein PC113_g12636 [Phytophthora cactorum]KAG2896008.1 hypothetical protein PC114_g15290 [Phytophthora cactorum]KAG3006411.1 hypothetical protein PC119_g14984 [Phytophthora cactorum]